MKNYYLTLRIIMSFLLVSGYAQEKQKKEYAPDDAYIKGSEYPYYGSENPWDRRFFTEHIKDKYKRRGQRQMLDIVEGKPAEAADYCRELLNADPNDLESLFNLAVAQSQMNDLAGALGTVREAVNRGLPFERFLAGPRNILRPLVNYEKFKTLVSEYDIQLLHGPLLGSVTDQKAGFWLRTVDEIPVQVIISESNKWAFPIKSEIQSTKSQNDYTTVVDVEGLQPATKYYYKLLLNGKSELKSGNYYFYTYPQPGSKSHFKVGFGGGAGYTPSNERIWNVIKDIDILAFLFMGDNVYIDMPEDICAVHYYTYYRRQSRPEFRRLISSTSIYAIWDDHDCGTDDIWLGPYKNKPDWKLPTFNLFQQNWNNPEHGDSQWPGGWFRFSIGDIDFFMLDGRMYRTNPYDKNPTMLGPVQKAWLLDELKESKATFKVLASPVPWSFEAKGDALDTWNGYREERNDIFNFLADNKIDGIILISADRHRSDAWRINRDNGYPLYEFESSRLTNQGMARLMPKALFGYNQKQSFGLLTFNTLKEDPMARYEIVNIDNEIIHSITLRKSEISY